MLLLLNNTPMLLFDSHIWHCHVTILSWVLLYTSFSLPAVVAADNNLNFGQMGCDCLHLLNAAIELAGIWLGSGTSSVYQTLTLLRGSHASSTLICLYIFIFCLAFDIGWVGLAVNDFFSPTRNFLFHFSSHSGAVATWFNLSTGN